MAIINGSFSNYSTSIAKPYIDWTVTSQNVSNNTSTVRNRLYFQLVNTAYHFFNTATHSCETNINGVKSATSNAPFTLNSTTPLVLVREQSTTVAHNSNGTKSCYIGALGNTGSGVLGTYNFGSTVSLPTITRATAVSTTAASSVAQTSATVGGNVTDAGVPTATDRGIYWGTTSGSQPNKISSGSGGGTFTVNMSGLTGGTQYYFRAFATNSSGTSYGSVLNFTTTASAPSVTTSVASNVTANSVDIGGEVTNNNGASVTARGVCWATTSSPTTANDVLNMGSGNGSFSDTITGLNPVTTYYLRAFATNSVGTNYGTQRTITTLAGTPVVLTTGSGSVTTSSVELQGEVTSDSGSVVTARGFVVGSAPNPTLGDTVVLVSGTTGVMTSTLSSLPSAITRNFRAFATNSYGTSYGSNEVFTTLPTAPTGLALTARTKTSISLSWVRGSGTHTIIRRATGGYPANINSGTLAYNGTAGATTDTGLTAGETYYYRAWSGTASYDSGTYSSTYSQLTATTVANFTSAGNALADDSNYATVLGNSGVLQCQVSRDGGTNWSALKQVTFTSSVEAKSFGLGETETWGLTWHGDNVNDTNFRVRLVSGNGDSFQTFKDFGFSVNPAYLLTGLEVEVKAAYDDPNFYLYYIKVNPYYGSSPLPVKGGSTAYDSTKKTISFHDGTGWKGLSAEDHTHDTSHNHDSDYLMLTGTQTVTGQKTFPNYNVIIPAPYSCKVRRTTTQSFSHNTPAKLTFNHQREDPYDMWDSDAPTKVTTPNFPGVWLISYGVAFDANTTGTRHCYIVYSGGSHYQGQMAVPGTVTIGTRMNGSFDEALAANTEIEVEANQTSGGALNTLGNVCYLSVTLLYRTG